MLHHTNNDSITSKWLSYEDILFGPHKENSL